AAEEVEGAAKPRFSGCLLICSIQSARMICILVNPARGRSPGFLSRCSDVCAMLIQLVCFSLPIFSESAMARSVLIVDDDPVQRRLLEAAVSKAGHAVVTADSGEAGLSALERSDIGVVILD